MKMKKLLALLLVLCMTVSLLPGTAIAAGETADPSATPEAQSSAEPTATPAATATASAGTEDEADASAEPAATPEAAAEPAENKEPVSEPVEGEKEIATLESGSDIAVQAVVVPEDGKYLTYIFTVNGEKVSTQIVTTGDTLLSPKAPEMTGYRFLGWYVLDEYGKLTDKKVEFGPVGDITATETVTAAAKFEEVTYVFFVDENGRVVHTASGKPGETVDVNKEGKAYKPGNPEEAVTGWFFNEKLTGRVDNPITLGEINVTVYAKVEKGHWITFNSDGGTYIAPMFFGSSANTTAPANPEKPGYTFAGWYNGEEAFSFSGTLDENVTLTARWTANNKTQYTVIYWKENADDNKYSYAESKTLTGSTGATTKATAASGKDYNGFEVQTIEQQIIKGDGSTVVNVYYKRIEYTITFHLDNPQYNCGKKEHKHEWWCYQFGCSKDEHTHTDACGGEITIKAKYGANIRDQWPTVNGSSTWSVNEKVSKGPWQSNIDTMPLDGDDFYGPRRVQGATSTAYYYVEVLPSEKGDVQKGETWYKLDHMDTSVNSDSIVTNEDRYAITGFTINESISTKNKDSYNGAKFYYTRNSYNVVFISEGTEVATKLFPYQASIANAANGVTPSNPAGKADYIFDGWYIDPAGQQEYVFTGKTMPAQNVTVYAKWVAPPVNGSAHVTMEGTDTPEPLDVKYGEKIDESELPTPEAPKGEGWVFVAWAKKNDDGTFTPFNFDTIIYNDITLYPYYANTKAYTVIYKCDTGPDVKDDRTYAGGAFADVLRFDETFFTAPVGKVFLGWAETENSEVAKYQPNDQLLITGDMTLYAVFGNVEETLILTYDANGGVGEDGNTQKEIPVMINGETTIINNPFTREGYEFTGWNTKADGTGKSFAAGNKARVTKIDDNILYAQWKQTSVHYTVEFYYQEDNATTYPTAPHTTDQRSAPQGTASVSVTDADKAAKENGRYVLDEANTNNVTEAELDPNGTTVLKLYFKLNMVDYTIQYYLKGTDKKVADDKTGQLGVGGCQLFESPSSFYDGFIDPQFDSKSAGSIIIQADESQNVIKAYYTVALTLTAKDASRKYNGKPLTQDEFTATGLVDGDTVTLSMTGDSRITNVSKSGDDVVGVPNVIDPTTVKVNNGAIPGYYRVTYVDGTLTVNPREIKLTSAPDSKVYDGTPLTKDEVNVTSKDKFVDGEGATYNVTGKQTLVGTSKNEFTYELKDGTNADNYSITTEYGELTVTPADEVTVTIKGNTDSLVYDGKEHKVTGYTTEISNPLYTIDDFTFKGTAEASGKDAGTYEMHLKAENFENKNTNFKKVTFVIAQDGKLDIAKREVILVSATDSKTYDGTALVRPGVTEEAGEDGGFVDGEAKGIEATGSITEVGSVENTIVYELNEGVNPDNYDITVKPGKLTITPIADEIVVTIVGNTEEYTYDGLPHSFPGDSEWIYEVTDITGSVLYNESCFKLKDGVDPGVFEKNAGQYYLGLKPDSFENTNKNFTNVTFVVTDGWLKINPVTIELTAASDSKEYDGTALTNGGYSVTPAVNGFKFGEGLESVTVVGSQTNAGSSENKITGFKLKEGTLAQNYSITVKPGTLTVTPAEKAVVKITGRSATEIYNGTAKTVEGFTAAAGTDPTITVALKPGKTAKATGTNVGTYPMGLTANDFTATSLNYKEIAIEYTDGALKINPNQITVTITGSRGTVTYDGKEHTVKGYTTDVTDNTITVQLLNANADTAKGTEPGTYNMGLKAADFRVLSANYTNIKVVVVDGYLTIEPGNTPVPTQTPDNEPTPAPTQAPAQEPEIEEIDENETPEAGYGAAWALINLICAILTVVFSVLLLVGLAGKNEKTEENDAGEEVEKEIKKKKFWRIFSIVPALAAVIVFLLTENMRLPMVLVDRWTLLMVIIALVQVLVMVFGKKTTKDPEEEAQA